MGDELAVLLNLAKLGARERITRIAGSIWRGLPSALLTWVLAALLIRLTVRDRLPLLSVLFYMTPLAVSAGLAGAAALIWLRRRCWRLAGLAGGLALLSAIWFHVSAGARHSVPPGPAGERIVFWNAGRGVMGWEGVTRTLQGFDADLIGLVEAGPSSREMAQFWRDRFPAYQVSGPERGMVLMARGAVIERKMGDLGGGGKYGHYEVHLAGRSLDVLLVDFRSDPFRSRREAFARLIDLIDRLADRPVIVMGDFNTPVDSAFAAPLAERLTNAFDAGGNGYNVTWPVPVPVLSLDQVWASPQVGLKSCELPWTLRSDHRPVVVTLAR
jgi:vancomycin resistance protein VanJ